MADKSEHWTPEQFRRHVGLDPVKPALPQVNESVSMWVAEPEPECAPVKPPKYRNVRTPGAWGRMYDSKKEAEISLQFEEEDRRSGGKTCTIPQVSIPVSPGSKVRAVLDFVRYFKETGIVLWIDVKAWDKKTNEFIVTREAKNKHKMLEENYGIEVIYI